MLDIPTKISFTRATVAGKIEELEVELVCYIQGLRREPMLKPCLKVKVRGTVPTPSATQDLEVFERYKADLIRRAYADLGELIAGYL